MELNFEAILDAHKVYNTGVMGGVVHDFLRNVTVEYHGGKCPVYYVCHHHNGQRIIVGGNYATNGKPGINIGEPLDFLSGSN